MPLTDDEIRQKNGFLTIAEMVDLRQNNVIYDLQSTLISKSASIGTGNVFYPSTIIICTQAQCIIGNHNVFWAMTTIISENGGSISIGDHCQFGSGGVRILCQSPNQQLAIGNGARLMNGAELMGNSQLGSGCQILGLISARNINLQGGGDYNCPNPNERGAVLKGMGTAKSIQLQQGQVINALNNFATAQIEQQITYHPQD